MEKLETCLTASGLAYRHTALGVAVTLPPALGDTLIFHAP
jgi:hypothetical protein